MIQANGVILDSNGVSEYVNPLINVYMNSGSKFQPTIGVAQVGKVVEATDYQTASFNAVAQIGSYEYNFINPSFEDVQNLVLIGLINDYPNVEFIIVA